MPNQDKDFIGQTFQEVKEPQDKNIVLKDILDTNPPEPTFMSDKFVHRQIKNNKDSCLITEDKEKASNLSSFRVCEEW